MHAGLTEGFDGGEEVAQPGVQRVAQLLLLVADARKLPGVRAARDKKEAQGARRHRGYWRD